MTKCGHVSDQCINPSRAGNNASTLDLLFSLYSTLSQRIREQMGKMSYMP